MQANEVAAELLSQVKMQGDYKSLVNLIANFEVSHLKNSLDNQSKRLAFWLNLYNAFFQIVVQEQPTIFKHKSKLFAGKHFVVANKSLSLDNIEHDILRRGQFKYGLGYIKNPLVNKFEQSVQPFELDCRIHFAMNCGAVSCPPIRFYTVDKLEEELELASRNFLQQESEYKSETNTVITSAIFSFFRGDFGGSKGIKAILKQNDVIPSTSVKLKFSKYNWQAKFENYT